MGDGRAAKLGFGSGHRPPRLPRCLFCDRILGCGGFDTVSSLSYQIKDLGLGQIGAPQITNLYVILNANVLQEGPDINEDFFHGG